LASLPLARQLPIPPPHAETSAPSAGSSGPRPSGCHGGTVESSGEPRATFIGVHLQRAAQERTEQVLTKSGPSERATSWPLDWLVLGRLSRFMSSVPACKHAPSTERDGGLSRADFKLSFGLLLASDRRGPHRAIRAGLRRARLNRVRISFRRAMSRQPDHDASSRFASRVTRTRRGTLVGTEPVPQRAQPTAYRLSRARRSTVSRETTRRSTGLRSPLASQVSSSLSPSLGTAPPGGRQRRSLGGLRRGAPVCDRLLRVQE
jgi:hypothetical protein